nr:retrovirus-related Pol polyprotein from transposon TNT 1-94 [Tanacetum cinerariifolium]
MTTLVEHIIGAGAENRPPLLEKSMYDSWASRIRLFIKGKKHGRMMLDSVDNGPLVYPTIEENGQTRLKKYFELIEEQKLQDECDIQATNIILCGLPPDVYELVNHHEVAISIWDKVKLLMKGTELSYQERESRLYDLFDKFAFVQGETLYEYSWRFSQLINDMHTIGMTMQQVQVNTKFLNALPPEWSKFVTDTKDLDAYDSYCDDLSLAKVVLMANLYSCDSNVLSEAQRIQPTLYDGSVIVKEHVVISVTDNEETLILEKEGRLKMLDKQNDPISIKNKIKISPIDYSNLNKIKEDFGKCLVTQKELSTEQAFWLKHSSFLETPVTSHTPVRIEAPSELPKENSGENLNAPTFNQLFEINELKAQSQKKDMVIRKLKDMIKSLSGKSTLENVKKDIDEIDTINIELEHSVTKLLSKMKI